MDKTLGSIRTDSTASGVTAEVTLDEVLVDDYNVIKWFVYVYETATPNKKEAIELYAMHDGTASTDATKTDFTKYAKLRVAGKLSGLKYEIDLSGSGVTQTMRLRVQATNSCEFKAIRMIVG